MGIHQARFLKYLHDRGLADTHRRKVWVFCGDGEMDEPKVSARFHSQARELDNLIFVVNCNLQRLDGPVRGKRERSFRNWSLAFAAPIGMPSSAFGAGAGMHCLRAITSGRLRQLMEECNDGQYQDFKAKDGSYIRQHFFGRYPETAALVADWSDEAIWTLTRGGHDPRKVYAAYAAAVAHVGSRRLSWQRRLKATGLAPRAKAR